MKSCCPSCGASGNVPDAYEGRRIRCPRCEKPFVVLPEAHPPPAAELGDGLTLQGADTRKERANDLEPEPAPYRELAAWGQILGGLAHVLLVLGVLGAAVIFFAAVARMGEPSGELVFVAICVGLASALVFVSLKVWAAVLLVAVDAARNVRAVRLRAEGRSEQA